METSYGQVIGNFDAPSALASMAAEGRRRKSAAHDLAETGEIGLHPVEALRAPARHPEACHHLVENEQGSLFVAGGPEKVQEVRLGQNETAVGGVGLEDDSGYFLAHCDRFMIVTCWIPLVDTTIKNGCLYVLPRAHKNGILRHYTGGHAGYLEIVDEDLPARGPVPIEMEAGGALFLTNLTPHSSYTNSSSQVRWSIDLRYQGKEAPNNVDEPPETYTPERDAVTMACYPPEADFVIKDKEHPENQVETAEHFRQVRERYEKTRPFMPGRGWTQMERKK